MGITKTSQGGMSIALVRVEFMQADQGGSRQFWFRSNDRRGQPVALRNSFPV